MALEVKNLPATAGNLGGVGSSPGSGGPPAGGHGPPLQCPCLENAMDRGAWRAAVHGVAESQARWKRLSARAPVHSHCCAAITTPISRAFPPSQTELPSLLTLTPRFPLFYFLITNMLISGTSYEWQRRQWQPTPVLLPGKSHGRRSLVGCSPWDPEELDTTE